MVGCLFYRPGGRVVGAPACRLILKKILQVKFFVFLVTMTDSLKDCKMLSTDAQIRYLVQWFHEWSDLQRSDFVPILAEKYANKAYVNGIVNSIANVNCQEKPMSLFECRVKLFREWFSQWSADQKESFLKQIKEIDSGFADKLNAELQNGISENHENGEGVLED
ncbi:uncharacterized protein C14orf119 isoform X2 [Tribolium castaneum]|uniref:uncharacterized protein C14orf119 isoform X2 n=1 Tax=Tribolium castaneum TaxID=7070 RepID=UPI0000D567AE|nr:PREDICTED: uncharacterized protein C14orf119 [Tribolium castaneum]|eukprot:XP_015836844.1 PREDICTED: uncharacterized protein C14orf119 [Tribolium castaneum]